MGGDLTGDFGLVDAVDSEDWESVAYLVQRYFFEMVSFGDHLFLVGRALQAIPEELRVAHPGLRPCYEFIGLETLAEKPAFDLDRLREGGEIALLEMRRIALAFIARRFHGRLDDSRAIIEQAMPMVQGAIRCFGSPAEMFAAGYLLHAGVTYHLSGDLDRARSLYLASWQWRHADGFGVMTHLTGGHLAMLAALSGDVHEARRWLNASASEPEQGLNDRFKLAMEGVRAIAEFVVAVDRLDLPAASALLYRLPTATRSFEFAHHALWAHTRWLSLIGRSASALQLIDSFSDLPEIADHGDGSVLLRARVEALLANGQVDAALNRMQDAPDDAWKRLNHARAMAMQLKHAAALDLLVRPVPAPAADVENEADILLASTYYGLGDHVNARKTFRAVLRRLDGSLYTLATIAPHVLEALFALTARQPEASAIGRDWVSRPHRPIYPFANTLNPILTARERVILRHLKSGATRKEIASMEVVTINTVKSQVSTLYRKLEVKSASEAISKASSLGLI